jgi:hypothetical protein
MKEPLVDKRMGTKDSASVVRIQHWQKHCALHPQV